MFIHKIQSNGHMYILYIHMSSIGSMFCPIFRQTSFLRQVRPLPRPFPRQCFSLAKTLPGLMTRRTSVGKDWPHGKVTIHENPHEPFFGFVYDVLLSFMMFMMFYDVLLSPLDCRLLSWHVVNFVPFSFFCVKICPKSMPHRCFFFWPLPVPWNVTYPLVN